MPTPIKTTVTKQQITDFIKCNRLYYLKHIHDTQRQKQHPENSWNLGTWGKLSVKPEYASREAKLNKLWITIEQVAYRKKQLKTANIHLENIIENTIKKYQIDQNDAEMMKALGRAKRKLVSLDKRCRTQVTLTNGSPIPGLEEINLSADIDRKYTDYLVRSLISSTPGIYAHPFPLTLEIGTYFLVCPSIKLCILEIVRPVELRKRYYENPEEYGARCYKQILRWPRRYFINYDKKTKTYGIDCWNRSFNLAELKQLIVHTLIKIQDHQKMGQQKFNKNYTTCYDQNSEPCEMFEVCKLRGQAYKYFEIKEN